MLGRMAILSFGPFRLDTRTLELYRGSGRVPLRRQPCRVLALLAARPGQLVSRDDLRSAVWPSDVHVSFDLGLNSCLKQIRRALGERAGTTGFIETLPGRGYRFTGPIARHDRSRPPSRIRITGFVAIGPSVEEATPIADGLTEDLTVALARLAGTEPVVVADGDDARAEVEFVVSGRVRAQGDRLRVTARLLDVSRQTVCWAHTFDAPLTDHLIVIGGVADVIGQEICAAIGRCRTSRRAPAVTAPARPRGGPGLPAPSSRRHSA